MVGVDCIFSDDLLESELPALVSSFRLWESDDEGDNDESDEVEDEDEENEFDDEAGEEDEGNDVVYCGLLQNLFDLL